MIEVRNLTKVYGRKKNVFTALDNITFTIPDGASVAIIGKSGSGKSTLMHCMSGLDRAEKGQVIIDGEDILQLKPKKVDRFRSTKMAFIFQSFFVEGNASSYSNVSLPLEIARVPKRRRRARILGALKAVELQDKVKLRARNLSGGQKQRLAIARAVVNEPRILFADEPTGNLDSVTGAHVEDLLFSYAKNRQATLVVVTHDPDLANRCDMQIHIKDGKIEKIEHAKPRTTANQQPMRRRNPGVAR